MFAFSPSGVTDFHALHQGLTPNQNVAYVSEPVHLSTEQRLASILRRSRLCGWRRGYPLPGKPDFAFPGSRIALFVDGCFWHGCPVHGEIPASNRGYWQKKIDANVRRDKRTARRLRALGWHVFRIWEHELGERGLNRKLGRIRKMIES